MCSSPGRSKLKHCYAKICNSSIDHLYQVSHIWFWSPDQYKKHTFGKEPSKEHIACFLSNDLDLDRDNLEIFLQ